MFQVTWISRANKIKAVQTPDESAAAVLYLSLKNSGYRVRLWNKNKTLKTGI